ncbi:Por secretion system C-terminal sorting domain-containing protein [Flexibacter flexilis DSM 6793]|uniref:Por secretion system C-terminal sorting domain-containing protein n=1 Tax=Flexibacter flexilis DSM 6793 TaxID=927664 RepID=A0A1I1EJ02_9BACT|nr:T9SS type A sorting domain-containing protein [Flexibacter flexilis]SFB84923.1 Por secretion system C-terminal sorting domain-containing protein [Flexibacter flexilis DSM 6793]
MKKTLTLLAAVVAFAFNALGQMQPPAALNQTVTAEMMSAALKNGNLDSLMQRMQLPYNQETRQSDNMLLETNAIKQRLDSIVIAQSSKRIFTYDATGHNVTSIYFFWNTSSQAWQKSTKTEYSYNSDNLLASYITFSWSNNTWVNSTKYIYTYTESTKSYISYSWDTVTNLWKEMYISEVGYNSSGIVILQISKFYVALTNTWFGTKLEEVYNINGQRTNSYIYNWVDSNSTWESSNKYGYSYNSDGKIISSNYYQWHNNTWLNNSKMNYTYNGSNYIVMRYNWNSVTLSWDYSGKAEYFFDNSGSFISMNQINFNSSTNTWEGYKTECTYNSNNYLTNKVDYIYNDSSWVLLNKIDYEYDINWNITQVIIYKWNTTSSSWDYLSKSLYNFNLNYTGVELLLPDYYTMANMKTTEQHYSWNTSANTWNNTQSYTYYYSSQEVTAVRGKAETVASVYPVPAKEVLNIVLANDAQKATLEVFDAQGRSALTQNLENTSKVAVNNLKSGLYLYRITANGQTQNGKFVKE